MYLVINKCVTAVKVSNFCGHYLSNRSTLDIGVLGYIVIVQRKEHCPEVLSIPPGTLCIHTVNEHNNIRQERYVRYNYMFRPCKWAIIRLSLELVRRLYNTCGDIWGDKISSYIIIRGVSIGCQHLHRCVIYHVKCTGNHFLTLACRWPTFIATYNVTLSLYV